MGSSGTIVKVNEKIEQGYEPEDLERIVPEHEHRLVRSAFARDRARVLHSAGWRRLGGTTQLHSNGSAFVRNRMTHSLEVAQIGREVGAYLGADADLVDVACLSHDLGHPPFGHTGEAALDQAARAVGLSGFEGNAQSLRILSVLEPKVFSADGRMCGLNLTRASLDATAKYPWVSGEQEAPTQSKYSAYPEDAAVLAWVRQGAPGQYVRSVEAQIMDLADDIAYSVHDVEDGFYDGHLTVRELTAPSTAAELAQIASERLGVDETLALSAARSVMGRWSAAGMLGLAAHSPAAAAALTNVASSLIGRFASEVELATRAAYGTGLTRYAGQVLVPELIAAEIGVLKAVTMRHLDQSDEHKARRAQHRELVLELAERLLALDVAGAVAGWLDGPTSWLYSRATSDAARRRAVVDHVASLTDDGALITLARLRDQDKSSALII